MEELNNVLNKAIANMLINSVLVALGTAVTVRGLMNYGVNVAIIKLCSSLKDSDK